jgi:hypothetical protein
MKLRILAIAMVLAASAAPASETMRCGKWVIDDETTLEELIAKCGAPASKAVTEADVYAHGPKGRIAVGKSVTERWTYDRGSRSFRMVVTIVDGKLKSIDKAE